MWQEVAGFLIVCQRWMYLLTSIVCIRAWYIFFLCAIELIVVKNTSMSQQLLHWMKCSFITMNTHTVVCFDSIPHTSSCCPKYSLERQMWIHPLLKIVPNKCTISSCLFDKNYREELFEEVTEPFIYLWGVNVVRFTSSVGTNGLGA